MDGGCGGAQPQRVALLKAWENTDAFRHSYPLRPVFQTQPDPKKLRPIFLIVFLFLAPVASAARTGSSPVAWPENWTASDRKFRWERKG